MFLFSACYCFKIFFKIFQFFYLRYVDSLKGAITRDSHYNKNSEVQIVTANTLF